MREKYVEVSGIIFGAAAILQLLRALNQWPIQIVTFQVPVWPSWVAAIVAGILCVWAFRSRGQ